MQSPTDAPVIIASGALLATAPALGDYGVIVVFALFGAWVNASRREDLEHSTIQTLKAMSRGILFAVGGSWILAHVAAKYLGASVDVVLPLTAMVIALVGDHWFRILPKVINWLLAQARSSAP